MYKRPPKRTRILRLSALYTLMTVSVIAIVAILILVVSNYRYNQATGTLEQRGLVQFDSVPSGATVEIDGKTLSQRTATKSSVQPGTHRFVMWRDGYESWIKYSDIAAGSLVWFDYARLVPKNRPVETIGTYHQITASLASPTKNALLLQLEPSLPEFRLVQITSPTPSGATLRLPDSLYTAPPVVAETGQPATQSFAAERWDETGRYTVVKHAYGDQVEYLVVDTKEPARSINVTREFSLPLSNLRFSGRSGNILYALSGTSLRKLDLAGGTVSRSLVDNAASFELYDTNTVTYATAPAADGSHAVGVYREGDQTPVVLAKTTDAEEKLSIALTSYYGTTYTVIGQGSTLTIYSGHLDNGLSGLTQVAKKSLAAPIEAVEFNASGSMVLARAGTEYASYSIERRLFSESALSAGSSAGFSWLDGMNVALVADDQLTMREIDGANIFTISPAKPDQMVSLSQNGTFIYSIGSTAKGEATLQRVRMILE